MVQREPVDSPLVVGSPAVADKYPVGSLLAVDRTRLVDSLLEADHSHPAGILLAEVVDRSAGSHLVGDNYPVDTHPAEVVDHLAGSLLAGNCSVDIHLAAVADSLAGDSHLADSPRRTGLAGWGLVAGQDSNSFYCSSFRENQHAAT